MLNNKKNDMTPFNMNKASKKQNPFLMPLIWGASYLMTRQFHLKIQKKNMKGIKPPFLVFSTHQGFSDYYIAPLALFPYRANYVSDMEGFAAFGEWLYRSIGCIGKRRYVADFSVVKNIRRALDKKQPVVIFPESRHSNVGTTAYIPQNMGRLAKMMKVPIVTLSVHGSYLANPFWDEERTRKVPMEAVLECIYTGEEVEKSDEAKIQAAIEEKLSYNEYQWQQEQKLAITFPKRAEGLELPLYQCRACGTLFRMKSKDHLLWCEACQIRWEMDEYGRLNTMQGKLGQNKFEQDESVLEQYQIPDWYEWERSQVEQQIEEGTFSCELPVRVEALPNAKGFVKMGEGRLRMDADGFTLEVQKKKLFFDHRSRESVQTEYNYRGRGSCIVLSDRNCCYYIYSDSPQFNPTRIQFAGEYYYQHPVNQ